MMVSHGNPTGNVALAQWSASNIDVNDFDFDGWEIAKAIPLRYYWSGAAAPTTRHADARVIWSNEALHILFDCQQQEPTANPRTQQKAIGLWDRDVCEIFLAPDPEATDRYFEFEAAPTGEWLDVSIRLTKEGRQSDWRFESGMTVAAKEEGERLLLSLRIPWSRQIPKPVSGTRWRANFFRCVGSGEDRGYLAWQPTFTDEPNFHVPTLFGWLQFE
jgi:alpha-galactosidase